MIDVLKLNCIREEIKDFYEDEDKNLTENFFSLSSKAFYENAFTEILAYIFSDKCKAKSKKLIFDILFEDVVEKEKIDSLLNSCLVKMEHRTLNGKRIDLIIYNNDCVIAFENKIHHILNNPLEEYEAEINRLYSRVKYKRFIVLSYKSERVSDPWKYISIKKKFDEISNKMHPEDLKDSWDYYIKDFISHFKENQINVMKSEEINVLGENYLTILKADKWLNSAIKRIAQKIKTDNDLNKYTIHGRDSWGKNEIALRAYPLKEDDNNNVTLVFNNEGKFYISVYYYLEESDQRNAVLDLIGKEEFQEEEKESSFVCFKVKEDKMFTDLEKALDFTNKQISKMKGFFDTVPKSV